MTKNEVCNLVASMKFDELVITLRDTYKINVYNESGECKLMSELISELATI